jgi:DNA-binding LacI/PurR family transcriptional regulator
VRLADELSLIGFDDTLEAYLQGLSSYSFNLPAIINAALEHVLAPKRTGRCKPMQELPGMVMERRTSGSVNAELRL